METSQDSDKISKIRKRIIVACDGTWQDADSDSERVYPVWKFWRRERYLMPASNVARLCRCISKEGVDEQGRPVPQLVFYQAGVGTSFMQRLSGGLTGRGITSHIRDAYSFICNNYEDGDEIFLFGFSRGAFTVRSLSSLLRTIGILNASGLAHFYSISQDWKYQNDDIWRLVKTPFADVPWGSTKDRRPSPRTVAGQKNAYVQKLKELDLLRCDKAPIGIKACGVWDTVGSLGVPQVWFLPQRDSKEYAFVDTNVEWNIEHAFQALALDERRGPFTPTIWAAPINPPKELKQCWFRGVHCDVGGGGYRDQELANLSLAWMITQLESKNSKKSKSLMQFNHDTFWKLMEISAKDQAKKSTGSSPMPELKEWGLGQIHDSMEWYYRLLTRPRIREPLSFTQRQLNPPWWKQLLSFFSKKTGQPLENTQECMHSSVSKRLTKADTPCDALRNWLYDREAREWKGPGGKSLPEDKLDGLELELANRWGSIVAEANTRATLAGQEGTIA
ncbi:hypothetical protein GJ744_012147 [Endocarpon pusillum]|uniref:T6SS Phospholipase effector Tle1-like catalytic domain-containing protein n=1 Tax=Endocarpon pusillum TaxID=364733 RepID=A0A8H7AFL5_9EURO|nr:hypothetical protein GJ744_012147 [Endocarpon pusillum]